MSFYIFQTKLTKWTCLFSQLELTSIGPGGIGVIRMVLGLMITIRPGRMELVGACSQGLARVRKRWGMEEPGS